MVRRIACLLVRDFSLAALVRANPDLSGDALALSSDYTPNAGILALSPKARAAGLRPAMTVAQARAILPELVVVRPSAAAEDSARDALYDVAVSVSPLVEEGPPGVVWLDAGGLDRLFGTEESIAAELVCRARHAGMEASAGIASGKEVALMAARCGGQRSIAPHREREFLAWLPLEIIDPAVEDDELFTLLARWGIRRLGDLARLPAEAVGTRLGRRGAELSRLARGAADPAPLVARRRAEEFVEKAELEAAVDSLEPLCFVLNAMLGRLLARLALRGLHAGDLQVELELDGHRRDCRRIALAAAGAEARPLLAILRIALEADPPRTSVAAVLLSAEPRPARLVQSELFAPPSPAPSRLEAILARIAAICGPQRMGTLRPLDSYRPEAVALAPFAPPPPSAMPAAPADGADTALGFVRLAVRLIRPAEEVEVLCTGTSLDFVRGRNLGARVVTAAGPWRRCGEWWRDEPQDSFARDYYDLALSDGGVYRIFRDLRSDRWFLDGIYD